MGNMIHEQDQIPNDQPQRLPCSFEEMVSVDPLVLSPERRLLVRGAVLRRKVLGRSLAFCTIKVGEHARVRGQWCHGCPPFTQLGFEEANAQCTDLDQAGGPGLDGFFDEELLGLCFSAAIVDTTGARADEEEAHFPWSSGNEWAMFPGRKGDLKIGARIEASVIFAPNFRREDPLVRRWRVLPEAAFEDVTACIPSSSSSLGHDMSKHHAARDAVNQAARRELIAKGRGPGLCNQWSAGRMRQGRASCGDPACNFRHYFLDEAEEKRAACIDEMRQRDRSLAEQEKKIYEEVGDLSHGDKVAKSQRAKRFASWLLAQYGQENLRDGYGVLDVAGGQGDLSWTLSVDSGVPCTLVDPGLRRGGELKSWQRRALRKRGETGFAHLPVYFDEANFASDEAPYSAVLNNASLVVGLHPDEATEAIVDLALAANRKFAIVPCCVFAHKFSHRKLPSGEPVRTLNQFCEYLRAKDSRIREALLDFEGRNKVLYVH